MYKRTFAILCMVMLFTSAWGPFLDDGDGPLVSQRMYFPLVDKQHSAASYPMVDISWRWGDINLAPGSSGIQVIDWDRDGQEEVLVGHHQMIFAVRHAVEYRFEQFWAVPNGVDWGMADFVSNAGEEMWVVDADGSVTIYQPFDFEAISHRKVTLPSGAQVVRALSDDIYGDGQMQLLLLVRIGSGMQLRAFSIPSLEPVWQYTLDAAPTSNPVMTTGQVDSDPAREVIFGYGVVIDPVRLVEQWFYNEGFGIAIQAANIDSDSADELIGMQGWNYVTAFDIDLQTPKWQIDTGSDHDSMLIADVTGNTFPEILVGDGQWGSIRVYDSQTQTALWTVQNPEHGVSGIGVGDADNDGELDLIWGSGWTSSGADHLYLTPIDRHQPTFEFVDYDGPFLSAPLQLDSDDALELVIFAGGTNSGYDSGNHFVIDTSTGAEEPDLGLDIAQPPSHYSGSWRVLSANVDTDPADELILGAGNDLYLFDHDGTRLIRRTFSTAVYPEWVGDVDGDGQLELVAHTSNRITVHAIATLEYEWQSVTHSPGVSGLAVGDVDNDTHMEIVFHGTQSSVKAYDGQTHLLDWQMPASQRASGVEVGNADGTGNLEILVVEDGKLMVYDGQTRDLILSGADIGGSSYDQWDMKLVPMTFLPYPQLIVAGGDNTLLFRHAYDSAPAQAIAGSATQLNITDIDSDHHLDLLLGQQSGVSRYRSKDMFPDVVPPFARAITPAPGTDLVSRNAFALARFSEDMDVATLTPANAQLLDGASMLPADLSYDPVDRLLRLSPQGLLPANTAIRVWLGPDLADLAGNGLDGNLNGVGGEPGDSVVWEFRTGDGVDLTGPVINNLVLVPNPAWAGMPVSLTADADDTNPQAASTVVGAEYFLDTPGASSSGTPIRAIDGLFDERQEQITVGIDTTGWTSTRTVFVHALDSVGNWGEFGQLALDIEPESAANWPTYGYGPNHAGYNPNQASATDLEMAWEKDLFAEFAATGTTRPLAQVAVANGVVVASVDSYFGTGGVLALAADNGEERWRRPFSNRFSINPPTIAYGNVYFQEGNHGGDSYLFALNVLTGQESWHSPFSAQWESYYAPTVSEGKVFVNGGSYGGMYGYDAFDGEELWFVGLPQYDEWTPAYQEGVIYSWVEGVLVAWDPAYGTQIWSLDLGWNWLGWSMDRVPVISDGGAYLINNSGSPRELIAIDLASRSVKWRVSGSFTVSPAIHGDTVFALDGATLRVFDAATGAQQWTFNTSETLVGAPVVTSGNVYVASNNHVWVVDRNTHLPIWNIDKGGWLTVANDQLFVAQQNGILTVYDIVTE